MALGGWLSQYIMGGGYTSSSGGGSTPSGPDVTAGNTAGVLYISTNFRLLLSADANGDPSAVLQQNVAGSWRTVQNSNVSGTTLANSVTTGLGSFRLGQLHELSSAGQNVIFINSDSGEVYFPPWQSVKMDGTGVSQVTTRIFGPLVNNYAYYGAVGTGIVGFQATFGAPNGQGTVFFSYDVQAGETYSGKVRFSAAFHATGMVALDDEIMVNMTAGQPYTITLPYPMFMNATDIVDVSITKPDGTLLQVYNQASTPSDPWSTITVRTYVDEQLYHAGTVTNVIADIEAQAGTPQALDVTKLKNLSQLYTTTWNTADTTHPPTAAAIESGLLAGTVSKTDTTHAPTGKAVADYAQALVASPTTGDIATLDATGQVVDSGKKLDDSGSNSQAVWSAAQVISQINTTFANVPTLPVCAAATTANITLSGTQTIDGVALTAGQYVLVKNQTNATQNGIYTVAAGAWSQYATAYSQLQNGVTNVTAGTVNKNTQFQLFVANPAASFGTSNVSAVATTKVPVADNKSFYVDAYIGSDTNNNGSMAFPFATITKALSASASFPQIMQLVGTFAESVTLASGQSNITLQSNDLKQDAGKVQFSGTWATSSGFTRGAFVGITFTTGSAPCITLGSGDAGRHSFENCTFITTNTNVISINATGTNDLLFINPDMTGSALGALTLPNVTAGTRNLILRNVTKRFVINGIGTGWTVFVEESCSKGAVVIKGTVAGLVFDRSQYPINAVLTTQAQLTALAAYITDQTQDGYYIANFASPSVGAQGDILLKQTAPTIATDVSVTCSYYNAPAAVSVAPIGGNNSIVTYTKSSGLWAAIGAGGGSGIASVTMAQRAVISAAGTYYNSTTKMVETYDGVSWRPLSSVNITELDPPSVVNVGIYVIQSGVPASLPATVQNGVVNQGDVFFFDGTNTWLLYTWKDAPPTIYVNKGMFISGQTAYQTLIKSNGANTWYYAPTAATRDTGIMYMTKVNNAMGTPGTPYQMLPSDNIVMIDNSAAVGVRLPAIASVAASSITRRFTISCPRGVSSQTVALSVASSTADSIVGGPIGKPNGTPLMYLTPGDTISLIPYVDTTLGNVWTVESYTSYDPGALSYDSTLNTSTILTRWGCYYLVNANSGNVTVTLPYTTFAKPGSYLKLIRTDSNTANTVTVIGQNTYTINGAASQSLNVGGSMIVSTHFIGNTQLTAEFSLGNATSGVASPIMAKYTTTAQTITSGLGTDVIFNADDTSVSYNASSIGLTYSNGVFTNSTASALSLHVTSQISWSQNNAGTRYAWLSLGSSPNTESSRLGMSDVPAVGGDGTVQSVSTQFSLPAGQSFRIAVYQNSGSSLATGASGTGLTAPYANRIQIVQLQTGAGIQTLPPIGSPGQLLRVNDTGNGVQYAHPRRCALTKTSHGTVTISGQWLFGMMQFPSNATGYGSFDPYSMHSGTTNTSRITVNKTGLYRVSGAFRFNNNTGGTLAGIRYYINGVASIYELFQPTTTGPAIQAQFDVNIPLNAGDYIEMGCYVDIYQTHNVYFASFSTEYLG